MLQLHNPEILRRFSLWLQPAETGDWPRHHQYI